MLLCRVYRTRGTLQLLLKNNERQYLLAQYLVLYYLTTVSEYNCFRITVLTGQN